jgi:predicted nucleic acid-binding protein
MSERAARLLERAQRREVVLRVHAIVVAEVVWVLQSFYGYSRAEISGALIPLLEDHGLRVEEGRAVIQALTSMAAANIDFADALLAERARMGGEAIASFDRDFEKLGVDLCEGL